MSNLSFWIEQANALVLDSHGIVIMAKDPGLEMRSFPGSIDLESDGDTPGTP